MPAYIATLQDRAKPDARPYLRRITAGSLEAASLRVEREDSSWATIVSVVNESDAAASGSLSPQGGGSGAAGGGGSSSLPSSWRLRRIPEMTGNDLTSAIGWGILYGSVLLLAVGIVLIFAIGIAGGIWMMFTDS